MASVNFASIPGGVSDAPPEPTSCRDVGYGFNAATTEELFPSSGRCHDLTLGSGFAIMGRAKARPFACRLLLTPPFEPPPPPIATAVVHAAVGGDQGEALPGLGDRRRSKWTLVHRQRPDSIRMPAAIGSSSAPLASSWSRRPAGASSSPNSTLDRNLPDGYRRRRLSGLPSPESRYGPFVDAMPFAATTKRRRKSRAAASGAHAERFAMSSGSSSKSSAIFTSPARRPLRGRRTRRPDARAPGRKAAALHGG